MTMVKIVRKPTLFEISLVVVCLITVILGYLAINFLFQQGGGVFNWNVLYAILIWLILIILFIIAAVNEDMKEELGILIKEGQEEMSLLRADLKVKRKK